MNISCECSVSQLGVSATGRSVVQRSPTDSVCVHHIQQKPSTHTKCKVLGGQNEKEGNTVELHLSGIIGMASRPDMQKMQIIGFFIKNGLHWHFEVVTNFYKRLFYAIYLFTHK